MSLFDQRVLSKEDLAAIFNRLSDHVKASIMLEVCIISLGNHNINNCVKCSCLTPD